MEVKNTPTFDATQLAIIQKKLSLENKIKSGVNWFFWIAGLSMVNTVIYLFGFTLTFVIGLGATQIVDGIMSGLATNLEQGGIVVRLIGLVIDFFIAGIFVLFGILGRKRFRWSIIFGMVLYAIDGVILLLFKDFFGAAFHAWALFGIWGGLKSINELKLLEASGDIEAIENIAQQLPSPQKPAVSPKQTRTRLLLIGAILLVIMACLVIVGLQQ